MKTITAKKTIKDDKGNKKDLVGTINYDFGDNLADAIKKHDDAVVFTNYKANGTVVIQAGIRRELEANKSQTEITAKFKGYKLGTAMDRSIDVQAAFTAKWASMSPEERKAMLVELQAAEKAAAG